MSDEAEAGDQAPLGPRVGWVAVLFLAVLGVLTAPSWDGDVFVSTEVVQNAVQPWSGLPDAPQGAHNAVLSDHATIYLPWLHHTRAELRQGRFPLWSSESYAGCPYFGNFSVGLLSPFTWLFVLLPFHAAFLIVAVLKWTLAGAGAMLFARRLGLSPGWAALAGLGYASSGYQVLWINAALTHVSVVAPWSFWALERLLHRPSPRTAAWVAMTQAFQLVGGHPETSFYVALGGGLYAVFRVGLERGARRSRLLWLAVGMGLGAALPAVQLLPFMEYAERSDAVLRLRAASFDLYEPLIAPWSTGGACLAGLVLLSWITARWAPWLVGKAVACVVAAVALRAAGLQPTLLQQLIPDWFGNPLYGAPYLGPLTFTDVCGGFASATLVLLAVVAVVQRVRTPWVVALAAVGLLVGARHVRLPWVAPALDALPFFGQTGGSRALAVVALVVVTLGAAGAGVWLSDPRGARRTLVGAVAFLVGCAAPVEHLSFASAAGGSERTEGFEVTAQAYRPGPTDWQGERPYDVRYRLPPGATGGRLSINGHRVAEGLEAHDEFTSYPWIGAGRVEGGRYRLRLDAVAADGSAWSDHAHVDVLRPPTPTWRWGAGLLAVVGLLWGGARWGRRVRAGMVAALVALELAVFGFDYNGVTSPEHMPGMAEPLPFLRERLAEDGPFRVLGARTALHPNLHYIAGVPALRGYDALEPFGYVQSLVYLFDGAQERIWFQQDFSTMDLGGALADVLGLRYVLTEEPTPDPGWREVWRRGSLRLFENESVLPLAFTVQGLHSLEESGDPDPGQFLHGDFLRRRAVIDEGPGWVAPGTSNVETFDHENGRMQARVVSDAGTILVVSENAFPGWEASVDGERTEVLRLNGFMLGVRVPAGSHDVALVYRPASFRYGGMLSGGALLLVLTLAVWRRRGG